MQACLEKYNLEFRECLMDSIETLVIKISIIMKINQVNLDSLFKILNILLDSMPRSLKR